MNDATPHHQQISNPAEPVARDIACRVGKRGTTSRLDIDLNAVLMPQNGNCAATKRVPVECGPLPFIIRRDGTWLYRGSPIGRKEMVCLFASVLRREVDGSYWLQTPAERGQIEVEDVPFVAVELDWGGTGRTQKLTFRTNVDEIVTADTDHAIRVSHDPLTCEPTPYLRVRRAGPAGAPWLEARIGRAVYYELVALAVPGVVQGRCMLGVWSCGAFFALGEMPPGDK